MPNELSADKVIVGDLTTIQGPVQKVLLGTVARTDTSAKTLGVIPASNFIIGITLYGATGSDAGTTATVSVGKVGGSGTDFVNAQNVKGAAGVGQIVPTAETLGTVGTSAVTVQAVYAETGTASTTGGPWSVFCEYVSS